MTVPQKFTDHPAAPVLARSAELHRYASDYAPAGVQGDGRFFLPHPIYIRRAKGARLWDVDGNEYIDYHGSYGPSLLGYNDDRVAQAVVEAMQHEGVLFALPHPREVELARTIARMLPSGEMTIFTNSGTEALYHVVRLARAFTGRTKFVKFEGSYHGWHDDLAVSIKPDLAQAGPDEAPLGVPASAGNLPEVTGKVIVLPFNDLDAVERVLEARKDEIAAVMVEPIMHSCGCLKPQEGFLAGLRERCDAAGVLLIFDEVVTGFRHAPGGIQELSGVTPDLTAFGKAMANGFAISGMTGRREIMTLMGPSGPVFLSGTYNGHLLNVAAAQATLAILEEPGFYQRLYALGRLLHTGITEVIAELGVRACCAVFGSVWSIYFTHQEPRTYRDIARSPSGREHPLLRAYRDTLRRYDIYLHPYFAIRGYISAAHGEADIERTIAATRAFFREHRSQLR